MYNHIDRLLSALPITRLHQAKLLIQVLSYLEGLASSLIHIGAVYRLHYFPREHFTATLTHPTNAKETRRLSPKSSFQKRLV